MDKVAEVDQTCNRTTLNNNVVIICIIVNYLVWQCFNFWQRVCNCAINYGFDLGPKFGIANQINIRNQTFSLQCIPTKWLI